MDGTPQLRIFISYRRSDSQAAARQLGRDLIERFGEANVFLDTDSLTVGMSWESQIAERVRDADVVLAVIGRAWLSTADERGRRQLLDPHAEDVLRVELETAMRGRPHVVPVLVDDAQMPLRDSLPRPFRPVTRMQARTLRHEDWDRDVEVLIEELIRLGPPPPAADALISRLPPAAVPEPAHGNGFAAVGKEHYEAVAGHLVRGTVVPLIGPGANAGDRQEPWEHGRGWLPDAAELATYLSQSFHVEPELDDLARVTQEIFVRVGDDDLYRALREVLIKVKSEPGPVQQFLADTPALLRARNCERYPMIITTNYDTALEQAFDAAHEPFDLVVFMATGEHAGRFLHVPWWDDKGGEPQPILVPNSYVGLPIDDEDYLERTVIVKIHGGPVYDAPRAFQLVDNYVVTEDDYIGYLSRSPIEGLVPLQILNKLRRSHYLFLGYGMRHWSLRVFLRRLWSEPRLRSKSWAVQRTLPAVETEFWERFDVERIVAPLSDYVSELEQRLRPAPPAEEP